MQKREITTVNENEDDINHLIVQIPIMNGFVDTLHNISIPEITLERLNQTKHIDKAQKDDKENQTICNEQ